MVCILAANHSAVPEYSIGADAFVYILVNYFGLLGPSCVESVAGIMGHMKDEMYFHADVRGLTTGSFISNLVDPYGHRAFTCGTTSIELARAFAVTGFGLPINLHGQKLCVYRVALDDPTLDPHFNLDSTVQIVTSESGTVVEPVEAAVSMSVAQATQLMAQYLRWPDGSRAYDQEGYATVPPKYRMDHRYDDHNRKNMLDELQLLDTYPDPDTIFKRLEELYP
jgi:hypothetical protein